jgi:hypothetical protein
MYKNYLSTFYKNKECLSPAILISDWLSKYPFFENEFNNLEQTVDEDMYKLFNGKISDQNTNEAQQQERKIK